MKVVISVIFAALISVSYAIGCWKCDNAEDNDDCLRKGREVWCDGNQHGCQTEARYHQGLIPPIRIFKRCKQGLACGNNVGQNEKGFFPFQCNPHIPESICRCCCDTDYCNKPELGCLPSFPTCRELNPIENGVTECHFGTLPPSVGEACTFRCDDGYELVGALKLNCNALTRDSADWDDDEPTCRPKRCLPAYDILENGFVSCTNENFVGSDCTHECDPGFVKKGSLIANCMVSQNWDYPQPECIPVTCPPPLTAPLNGEMQCSDGNRMGSICDFRCEDGFALIGSPVSDCMDDYNNDQFGVWSDPVPKCVALLCQPQSRSPTDGDVKCTNANMGGSVCSYSCDPGFAVNGAPERECVDDGDGDSIGMWTDDEPTCEPIQCRPAHVNPTNGYLSCTNQNFVGSVCDFYCKDGYRLQGSALSICEDDGDGDGIGTWSDPPPTCISGPCEPELVNPANGAVKCTDRNNMRSICTFACARGYYMATEAGDAVQAGRLLVQCTTESIWDKEPPVCLPITCNPPHRETDALGVVCSNQNNYKSNCKFSCKDGSRPDGPQESICNDDGNGDAEGVWVPPRPPTCRPQFCQPPQIHPQSGRVACSNRNMHGSICSFTCSPGFYLIVGQNKAVGDTVYDVECEGTQWNRQPPKCAPIKCLPPHGNPSNGAVRCSNANNYRSRCDFTCDLGYAMSGEKQSTCLDDGNGDQLGEWSSPPPTCTSTGCDPPLLTPDNGRMSCTDGNNFRSVCTFNCNAGYYMVAAAGSTISRNVLSINCPQSNIWSDREPSCRPITCPPPRSDPKNGKVSCTNDIEYKSTCSYTCEPGYKLSSKFPTTTCDDDGNGDDIGVWSRPPPRCDPMNCAPKQVAPTNGKVVCTKDSTFGSVCTFTCNVGYYMVDTKETMIPGNKDSTFCEAGNKWSKLAPKCRPIKCPPPHKNPNNGAVSCSNRNFYKSKCSFKCDPGFDLSGSPASTCEADGNTDDEGIWSDPPPQCTLGACKPPQTNPSNGKVVCSDGTNVGSICNFVCNSGYYMIDGVKTVKSNDYDVECLPSKAWSRKKPSCAPIRCRPPHNNPKDGSVVCSNSNFYGSECEFECDVGFKLVPGRGSLQTTEPYFSVCEEDSVLGDEDGAWSDLAPSCQRDICNPPRTAPDNGKVTCTNKNLLGSICTYTCDDGFYMEGPDFTTINKNRLQTVCGNDLSWTVDSPTCKPIVCPPPHTDPDNGAVSCTNENFYQSVCTFTCNSQYVLVGLPRSRCLEGPSGDGVGRWSDPAPRCSKNFCDPKRPKDPINGYKVCTDTNNLGSVCEFACDDYHRRVGPLYSRCVRNEAGKLEWTSPPPKCQENCCEDREKDGFSHGSMSCTKGSCATSVCSYECLAEGYSLYPKNIDTNTCKNDTNWDRRMPCCARPCPPNAEMDAVIVLDSSSSVGLDNWFIMKAFVRGILASFTVAEDTANFGIFRYNAVVDKSTQILLKDYTSDIKTLLEKYDDIPYDGSGTRTGQALEYVRDVMLKASSGNRKTTPDLVIVLTDGKSQDAVDKISDELRSIGAFIFVVGITPPRGALDMGQLLQIAGDPANLLIADSFEGLDDGFALSLTDKVCGDPCVHRTHFGETPTRKNAK